jgi:cytochrome c
VSAAPDDFAERPRSVQNSATGLLLILMALILAAGAAYVYHHTRIDLEQKQAAIAATGGDPSRAPAFIKLYGCAGCHTLPGAAEPAGQVGPDLTQMARRVYVGGVLTNTPDNLIAFIVDPRSIDPKSAMPTTGISLEEARDVAAYLYSIKQ